ncbi:MAG TPA: pilus assembly protein PilM [Syntrophales bacterium]|nr:pilus assembly protein PilM [Syntrophales bacterium]
MSSRKDISSTEKLLDLIRSDEYHDDTPDAPPSFSPTNPPKNAGKENVSGFFAKKSVSVGVDIGSDELKLVKVKQLSGGQWRLLDYRNVPIKAGMSKGTAEFAGFLRSALLQFCGSRKNFTLWSLIQSDKVGVQSIRIPKVGKKQLENAVYWTAKKNISFDEKDTILDFEVQGEVIESGITKLSVLVCTASKREVEEMENLFNSIGFPLTGLTVAPFALQNLFRTDWMPFPGQTVAALYIGDSSSRIDIFSGGNLEMTRGIRAGINSMAESLMEEYAASGRTSEPIHVEDARDLLFGLSSDYQPDGKAERFGLTREDIFAMINPALERLVRQVERTFEHHTIILGNEDIDFIYVFSDMGSCMPVVDYLCDQLKKESDVLDPMTPESPFSGMITSTTSVSQRIPLVTALSLALSNLSRTPNLIFPYSEKEKFKSTRRVNQVIFSMFAVLMIIAVGIFFWMGDIVDKKEIRLSELQRQLGSSVQNVEQDTREMISKIRDNKTALKDFKKRYLGVAVVGELSKLTPTDIYLSTLKANMGADTGKEDNKSARGVNVTGVVTGSSASSESLLAKYVLELQNSPIFKKVTIDKSNTKPFHSREALHFSLNIDFAQDTK